MIKPYRNSVVILFLLFSQLSSADDCSFDDFPVMDGMRVAPIMSNTSTLNGQLQLQGFVSDDALRDVVIFYHRRWEESADSVFAVWRQVTTMADDCMLMVQVAEMEGGMGSYGRLSISVPNLNAGNGSGIAENLIMPDGAEVVSDMTTQDGDKEGRVTILATDQAVDTVVTFFKTAMPQQGWTLNNDFRRGVTAVLVFHSGLDESNIVVAATTGGFTQIMINKVSYN